MVLVGTGDREHPLYANASVDIVNRFYGLKDKTGMDASGWTTIVDNTASTSTSGPSTLFDAAGPYNGTLGGYYLTLTNKGEKVVNASTTIGSNTYFGTNQPPTPSALVCNDSASRAVTRLLPDCGCELGSLRWGRTATVADGWRSDRAGWRQGRQHAVRDWRRRPG
jgi:type IV pilus assembly protein PilY1